MGRPSLLTPERQARILELVKGGLYLDEIATEVGIGVSTLHAWRVRGQQARNQLEENATLQRARTSWDRCQTEHKKLTKAATRWQSWADRPYLEFLEAYEKAQVEPERDALVRIRLAGAGGQLVERKTRQLPDGTVETVEKYTRPQWQALAWFLERRYRERWQRSSEMVHLMGQVGADDDDPLLQVVDELAALRSQRAAGSFAALPQAPTEVEAHRVKEDAT